MSDQKQALIGRAIALWLSLPWTITRPWVRKVAGWSKWDGERWVLFDQDNCTLLDVPLSLHRWAETRVFRECRAGLEHCSEDELHRLVAALERKGGRVAA